MKLDLSNLSRRLAVLGWIAILGTGAIAQSQAGQAGATRTSPSPGSSRGNHGAPEIDPSLASAGLILLAGGTLVLMGRRRSSTRVLSTPD